MAISVRAVAVTVAMAVAGMIGVMAVRITVVAIDRFGNDRGGALQNHLRIEFRIIEHALALGIVSVAISVSIPIDRFKCRFRFHIEFERFRRMGSRSMLLSSSCGR